MYLNGMSLGICLLSLSLLFAHRGKQLHRELAAGIVACLGWFASGVFLLESNETITQIYIASLPFSFFAILPSLYWYQTSLIAEQDWTFARRELKHLFPVSIALLLTISIILMPADAFKDLFLGESEPLGAWATANAVWFGIMLLLWFLLSSFYLYRILKLTFVYHQKLNNLFADHENKKLNWLIIFTVWMFLTWIYSCTVLIFDDSLAHIFISEKGVSALLLILIWLFCFNALRQKPELLSLNIQPAERYERSGINNKRLARIAAKVEQAVLVEKAYLDADINAANLSEKLGISTHYLSQTFTQQMNTTFYDYINAARVDAAKNDLKSTNKTVLEITNDIGFNTRSSFYNAFKKHTGMTPSAYRSKENS